eukprot:1821405-Alexandrium_andersonii.AAC.1
MEPTEVLCSADGQGRTVSWSLPVAEALVRNWVGRLEHLEGVVFETFVLAGLSPDQVAVVRRAIGT